MECAKWVELGLLYTSGELAKDEIRDFERHLQQCESCKQEIETYRAEKNKLYTRSMLEVPTPEHIDTSIRQACAKLPRPTSAVSFFPAFVRMGVVPVLLLLVGFAGGVYIALDIERAESVQQEGLAQEKAASTDDAALAGSADGNTATDETGGPDSIQDADPSFNHQRKGTLSDRGVVPVDLPNR